MFDACIGCKTRIEVIIFSIAIYLNRGSQARGMTEAGRGVAWKSWIPRRNRIGQEFLKRQPFLAEHEAPCNKLGSLCTYAFCGSYCKARCGCIPGRI